MRRFIFCVSLFVFVALLAQLSFAQNAVRDLQYGNVLYEQASYNKYQHGVVTNSAGAVDGVLLLDVNGVGEPIPGTKITFTGGDDFIITVETDENGLFTFDPAEVGSYSAIVEYKGKLYSLDFKVTAYEPSIPALAPDTGVANDLKLVVVEDIVLRFAANRGTVVPPGAVPGPVAAGAGGAAAGGFGAAAGAGNFGMLGAALGAAGLATGIAALASDNDKPVRPVSVGTPSAR
ncbi:MAG: carboxypeptidase-like regulatory domain-containing protein [Planctomycetaceae bacterium]|nr:carboxypeptidase-like regulatory domain-containing protein [Planctomycetaceae bacterium]